MSDDLVRVQQWLFVDAPSPSAARALVKREFVDGAGCDWADAAALDTRRAIVPGSDARTLAGIVTDIKAQQRVHLARLWEVVRDVDWDAAVTGHDPYRASPDGGLLPGILALAAQLLAGQWSPYSAGWDTVSVTADLAGVRARMKSAPLRQFAVPVLLDY